MRGLIGDNLRDVLVNAAGDDPNKLPFERTPLAAIMQQYGNLVLELGEAPPYSEWQFRRLKPSKNGLAQKPHNIKWSELPHRFVEWVRSALSALAGGQSAKTD